MLIGAITTMSDKEFTLESIEASAIEITQEAIDIRRGVDSIKEKLPSFFNSLRGFVDNKLFSFQFTNTTFDFKIGTKAQNTDYTKVRKDQVIVPHGLAVTYLEYLSVLDRCQDHCDSLFSSVLIPFEKYLGKLLSNPDDLRSMRENGIIDTVYGRDLDSLKSTLSKAFDRRVGDKVPYGDLIQRQRDVSSVIKSFNELKERTKAIKHKDVTDTVNLIVSHMDTLIERMDDEPEVYKASGITISSLTKLSYLLASEVEFYAVHNYNVIALEGSIKEALKVAVK